jgi:hypothetical protein
MTRSLYFPAGTTGSRTRDGRRASQRIVFVCFTKAPPTVPIFPLHQGVGWI